MHCWHARPVAEEGFMDRRSQLSMLLASGWLAVSCGLSIAQDGSPAGSANIRTFGGMRIVRVKPGARRAPPFQQVPRLAEAQSASILGEAQSVSTTVRPPLFGFSPKVALTLTSQKQSMFDQDTGHILGPIDLSYSLSPPAAESFVIGVLDSGAQFHLVAAPYSAMAGLTGSYLTTNPIDATGVGTISGVCSFPIGLFAAGLGAVGSNELLDTGQVVGHYNVAVAAADELDCGQGEGLTALVGVPLMTFYKCVIRVSQPREVVVGGATYKSPDVQLLQTVSTELLTQFPRSIAMNYSDPYFPPWSASYNPGEDPEGFPDFNIPASPTMLALAPLLPTGGLYTTPATNTVGLLEGEPGPLNQLQWARMLVDTGAQASIITPTTASNLNLDLFNPDFTVDVCGVGGLETDVPGFYVDFVRINAGGVLDFEQAPFIVYSLPSVGGPLNGVLGMNFFWNRDVLFDVATDASGAVVDGSGFLRLSNPMPMPYGDYDQDLDVDAADLAMFQGCLSGPAVAQADPACTWFDADGDEDVDQVDFGFFQVCLSGENVTANVNCKP
jgi:hypothetical protein